MCDYLNQVQGHQPDPLRPGSKPPFRLILPPTCPPYRAEVSFTPFLAPSMIYLPIPPWPGAFSFSETTWLKAYFLHKHLLTYLPPRLEEYSCFWKSHNNLSLIFLLPLPIFILHILYYIFYTVFIYFTFYICITYTFTLYTFTFVTYILRIICCISYFASQFKNMDLGLKFWDRTLAPGLLSNSGSTRHLRPQCSRHPGIAVPLVTRVVRRTCVSVCVSVCEGRWHSPSQSASWACALCRAWAHTLQTCAQSASNSRGPGWPVLGTHPEHSFSGCCLCLDTSRCISKTSLGTFPNAILTDRS